MLVIQPTRTVLLALKEKALSVGASIDILKAKRLALIREFLNSTMPFLESRKEISNLYGKALDELAMTIGSENRVIVESLAMNVKKEPSIEIVDKKLWGLKYKDVGASEPYFKGLEERDYDYRHTTCHLEECFTLFERIVDLVIEVAKYESKLKRLSEEIIRTTRRMRVLEERVLPRIHSQIKTITQHLEEREREAHYRLKRVKSKLQRQAYRKMGS